MFWNSFRCLSFPHTIVHSFLCFKLEAHVHFVAVKDAQLTSLCRRMMILEKVGCEHRKPMIVLHEHLWSAITWPLIETPGPGRSTYFSLDPNGQAEWFTMFDPSSYEVVPAVPVMSEGWLCLVSSSASQPFTIK